MLWRAIQKCGKVGVARCSIKKELPTYIFEEG
jgi:hypothetical protein